MKKKLLAILAVSVLPLMGLSSHVLAETAVAQPPAAQTPGAAPTQASLPASAFKLSLMNPATHQVEALSINQVADADKMRMFVAALPNATELYDTYVSKGYFPFHAMILTNWDIREIIRKESPDVPDDPSSRDKVLGIHKLYQPAQ